MSNKPARSKLKYGIGLDFGTTKSHVSVINLRNRDLMVMSQGGSEPKPTIVFASRTRRRRTERFQWSYVVGEDATSGSSESGEAFFADDIKRRLRTGGPNYDLDTSPEILVSVILRSLYAQVSHFQGPENITITIPADIGMNSRAAMMYAARLAGFEGKNINLLEEPLAAFLSFYDEFIRDTRNKQQSLFGKKILIFDFGGGTCDVASVAIGSKGEAPIVNIKASDPDLGGNTITTAMMDYVFGERFRLNIPPGRTELEYGVRTKAELWKEEISNAFWKGLGAQGFVNFLRLDPPQRRKVLIERIGSRPVTFQYLEDRQEAPGRITAFTFPFEAEDFDNIVNQVIQEKIFSLLKKFEHEASEYAYVLLVGGSSLLPQVSVQMYDWLKTNNVRNPETKIWKVGDPASYVSKGAALYQYYKTHNNVPVRPLMDRTLSLLTRPDIYLSTDGDFSKVEEVNGVDELIPSNQHLPFPDIDASALRDQIKNADIVTTELPYGETAQVLRIEYSVSSGDPNKVPTKQTLFFCEDQELLDARVITLPNVRDPHVKLDLRVNEYGLLEVFARHGEGTESSEELDVDYRCNPNKLSEIDDKITEYNLNFPLDIY